MKISHHPAPERLADYAAGRLDEGQRLLVAAHLEGCPHCRASVSVLDHVGGALLSDLPPAEMEAGALDRALARLDVTANANDHVRALNDMPELPNVLRRHELEPWRWAGPGVQWRGIKLDTASANRVFLLKAQPGTRLPQHSHIGSELTLV